MCKMPFYKMYPADAETDAAFRMMTYAERGIYWTCLNLCWINGGLPADPGDRARMLGLSRRQADKAWVRVGRCFVADADGMLINPRQERERTEAISKSEQAREAIQKRWNSTKPVENQAETTHTVETAQDTEVFVNTPNHTDVYSDVIQRASVSVSSSSSDSSYGSDTSVVELKPQTEIAPASRFPDWWAVWSATRGTNHKWQASEAWRRGVPPELEEAAIECAASYLASLDNPARGYNPEKFLTEQARDHFAARWPAFRILPVRESATDRAIRVGHERIEKYGRL